MKKSEVKIGSVYIVKVSGRLCRVKIIGTRSDGRGWTGTNLETNREVRIKSATRLRLYIPQQADKNYKAPKLEVHPVESFEEVAESLSKGSPIPAPPPSHNRPVITRVFNGLYAGVDGTWVEFNVGTRAGSMSSLLADFQGMFPGVPIPAPEERAVIPK